MITRLTFRLMLLRSIKITLEETDAVGWRSNSMVRSYINAGCERDVAEANKGSSDEVKSECIMRLSWALVHSRQPEDVQRGIAMLEASLSSSTNPLQVRERLYLLAVGYYREGIIPKVGSWWKDVCRLLQIGDRP
ncbi:hypothetical protein Nepgr_001844 [Nepenthes gracilis]|uniref:Uncharacterized protein n=1 Tax=Nepenthes gracilis TaxID=150966 RepID=A0AAD3RY23_NEPGR|nr:hypothetical protein Nepgr_001844 [Nepenthes gracilis]